MWDLFRSIPSIEKDGISVLDEYYWLNKKDPNFSLCRATEHQGQDAHTENKFGLSDKAQEEIMKLFFTPDEDLYDKKITDYFDDEVLNSNFWMYWRTMFAFSNWHSALEMKLYLKRFVHHEAYHQMALEAGVPAEDAYLLSHIVKNMDDLNEMYPDYEEEGRRPAEEFESAVGMLKQYLDEREREDLLVDYEVSWKSKEKDAKKAKQSNMVIQRAFFDLLMMYAHDVILHHDEGPAWYRQAVNEAEGSSEIYGELIVIASEEKDKVNKYNDLNLLMDQAFYKLEGFNHEHGI